MMSVDYTIVPAAPEHLPALAAKMRAADRREVWASHRHSPQEALAGSLAASDRAWVALVEGSPALIWGVGRSGSLISGVGRPWLLGTDDLSKCLFEFIRRSQEFVAEMHRDYWRLENYVHGENRLSRRWLAWCGFEIDPQPRLVGGEPFHRFWREANV